MRRILKRLKKKTQEVIVWLHIGVAAFSRYRGARVGEKCLVKIKAHHIFVRKGPPDLRVAASCLLFGEFRFLRSHLPATFDGVIVDAGGYIGTSALALSDLFPNAQIITVEPALENLEILSLNVLSNEKIRVIRGALVGSGAGSITLKDRGTGEWGYTVVQNPHDNPDSANLHETPTYRLQDLGVNCEDIGLLKLDIEGGELDLLVQDSDSLGQIKVIVAELHDRIAPGCSEAFENLADDRFVAKVGSDKKLSVRG